MKTYEIVAAEPSDATTLSEISFLSKQYWGYPDEWMELWITDLTITEELINLHDVFKLVVENKTIGFTMISNTEEVYEVEHCWLLPEFIGHGYGSRLLSNVLSKAKYLQKRFKVIADPNAVPFYEKFGFRQTSTIPSQPEGRLLPVMHMVNG